MRIASLDAMRGIAAMFVLISHIIAAFERQNYTWAHKFFNLFELGIFGVCLFFIVSGFVIPFSFARGLRGFWISRAFRLLPALWLSMAFAVALGAPLDSARQLIANAFMVTDFMDEEELIGPYWSLNWELLFYGIATLLYVTEMSQKAWAYAALSVICSLVIGFVPFVIFLQFMFLGTLLRMVMLEQREDAKIWLVVAGGCLLGSWSLWLYLDRTNFSYFAALALVVPTFLFLWNRLNHPILIWLGSISYSLYLFHKPIFDYLEPQMSLLALTITATIMSLALSALLYRHVEKPMVELGRQLASRRLLKQLERNLAK